MLGWWWYTCNYMSIIIVGLGNPDGKYEHSRHNVGREAVKKFLKKEKEADFSYKKKSDALVAIETLHGIHIKVVLPETMMNCSGKSVLYFVHSKNAAHKLVVVRDDLDLPIGTIKMSFGHGSGGHKGVESIIRLLKTKEFIQIKIGISATTPKGKLKKPNGDERVILYVLGKFSPKDQEKLKNVFTRTEKVLSLFISDGIEKAMQFANSR